MVRIANARFPMLVLAFFLLVVPATLSAKKVERSERWYAMYYEGSKVGRATAVFKEYEEDGKAVREASSKGLFRIHGKTDYDHGSYKGYGSIKGSVSWDFRVDSSHKAVFEDGALVSLVAKRSPSKGSGMKAKSAVENGALVLHRSEGAVEETIPIGAGDYDLTSDPAELEPFLQTVGDEPITKRLLSLADAEVRETTFERRKDGRTKDVDGTKRPCLVYRATDDERKATYKTIDGMIVYTRVTDKQSSFTVSIRQTTKKRAKSADGR